MIADMMATTIKPAGPTIEPGSRPELYVGVDVPAKVDGRVMMAERYKQLFPETPGGAHLHILYAARATRPAHGFPGL